MPIIAVGAAIAAAAIAAPAVGAVVAGGLAALDVAGALSIVTAVGATVSAIGVVTGNKDLALAGGALGIVGGIGSLAVNAGVFGADAGTASVFGSSVGSAVSDIVGAFGQLDPNEIEPSSLITNQTEAAAGNASDIVNPAGNAAPPIVSASNPASPDYSSWNAAMNQGYSELPPASTAPSSGAIPTPNLANPTPVPNAASLSQAAYGGAAPGSGAPFNMTPSAGASPMANAAALGLNAPSGTSFGDAVNSLLGFGQKNPMVAYGVVQAAGSLLQGLTNPLTPAQISALDAQAGANRAATSMSLMQQSNLAQARPVAQTTPVTGAPAPLISNPPPGLINSASTVTGAPT
jgi:hypothetical protein